MQKGEAQRLEWKVCPLLDRKGVVKTGPCCSWAPCLLLLTFGTHAPVTPLVGFFFLPL